MSDQAKRDRAEEMRAMVGIVAMHHINGDPTDDRPDNLVLVNVRENRRGTRKPETKKEGK